MNYIRLLIISFCCVLLSCLPIKKHKQNKQEEFTRKVASFSLDHIDQLTKNIFTGVQSKYIYKFMYYQEFFTLLAVNPKLNCNSPVIRNTPIIFKRNSINNNIIRMPRNQEIYSKKKIKIGTYKTNIYSSSVHYLFSPVFDSMEEGKYSQYVLIKGIVNQDDYKMEIKLKNEAKEFVYFSLSLELQYSITKEEISFEKIKRHDLVNIDVDDIFPLIDHFVVL